MSAFPKRPSRRFQWISAIDHSAVAQLEALQRRMSSWYSSKTSYYSTIDFTRDNWVLDPAYRWMLGQIEGGGNMLEIGCGRANILEHRPSLAVRYTGVDFSSELVRENSERLPQARFLTLRNPVELDFPAATFEVVLSVFVLEHCVFPHFALSEWSRVLKPGGRLLLLCPDFLGSGLISSQRVGFSEGTGREKLSRGKIYDAVVTGLDTRIRMPVMAGLCRLRARSRPRFYVNLAPTCFDDSFRPDVDAVYLTYQPEMVSWLRQTISFAPLPNDLTEFLQDRRLILLNGTKR